MNDKISIIIPVFNVASTIGRCLDSVLNQTYTSLEIIVVDDGSTDNTTSVLDTYQDNRIRVIHQKNSVQGIARNVGMKYATGEYIGFVDGDDSVDKNMYECMIKAACEHNADVVQCNISNVYSDGTRKVQLPEISCVVQRQNEPQYFDKYMNRNIHSFEVCNKLIKKDFLMQYQIMFHDTKKVHAEDLLFNLEMAMKMSKIVFLEDHYYFYYLHCRSHSKANSLQKLLKLCDLFTFFFSEVKDREITRQVAGIAVLVLMQNLARLPHTKENREQSKKFLRREDIRRYLFDSMRQSKKMRHKLLILTILTMPTRVKLFIIKSHYFNMR